MKPVLIRRLTMAAFGLFGVSGAAYGCDQHLKRRKEQAASRRHFEEVEKGLKSKEGELEVLRSALGDKNDQVRLLVAEVEMLREQAAALRGSA